MNQPLNIIRNLIKELPDKDPSICEKYLQERNFECIREIVESDIYKAKQKADPFDLLDNESDISNYIDKLLELKSALDEYISYLEVPDNSDDLYEDCYEWE